MSINPIERNDVDLSKLFVWKTQKEITDEKGNSLMTVYMRLPGDADINQARVYAIRGTRELRKILRDSTSDEYVALIPEREDLSKDAMIDTIVIYSMRELAEDVRKNTTISEPKDLKADASLEEQEEHQAEVDKYPKKKRDAVESQLDKRVSKLRKELASKSEDELYEMLLPKMVEQLCENKMVELYRDRCISLGSFVDSDYKTRIFKDADELRNLPPDIKHQFVAIYSGLEMGIEELKN